MVNHWLISKREKNPGLLECIPHDENGKSMWLNNGKSINFYFICILKNFSIDVEKCVAIRFYKCFVKFLVKSKCCYEY